MRPMDAADERPHVRGSAWPAYENEIPLIDRSRKGLEAKEIPGPENQPLYVHRHDVQSR